MQARKVLKFAQKFLLSNFLTFSANLHAEPETYRVSEAGYVIKSGQQVSADCQPGDELVKGSCEGYYELISGEGLNPEHALQAIPGDQTYACSPRQLRHNQVLKLIVEATCKRAKTAKLAQKN